MAIGLGIALPTQKRENQTLNAEGTLLWLLLVPSFLLNSFLIKFDLVFSTDPPCLIHVFPFICSYLLVWCPVSPRVGDKKCPVSP